MIDPAPAIGVVGVGAMGGAMAAGLAQHARVVVEDQLPGRAAEVAALHGVTAGDAAVCDIVVMAVKPDDLEAVLAGVAPRMRRGAVLVSVAAGWTLTRLRAVVPEHAVVRLMPNLAVADGLGVVAMASTGLDAASEQRIRTLLQPLGAVVVLDEGLFGVATAIGGSGPGFVAYLARALEDSGVDAGLERCDARTMVQGVLAGTASLLAGGGDPAALQARVTSPGGTTAAGIKVLEDAGVARTLGDAVRAAAARSAEL
ncbi:MAG: pyrroline-5-carboxylate reductase [Thermoleophilia bacterium]|nr:pyrroline-5-carboxylate reductase [Thermoleophilia bacterium]